MTPEANIKAVISADDRASRTLRRFGQNADKSLGKTGKAARGAGVALAALGVAATGGMGLAAKAAIDFESTFANVRKTVDASEREFELLENNMRDLSRVIPTPVGELNNLAAIAGQLGIEGVDNITKFTETIAKLGDTTDIAGEQAALSISRLMNIMGTAQKDVDRMGATIVDLGNNFAARESEIVEISTSLAGFGQRVGLTESQVLAFGATIAASGGKVQAAGTAFQKVAGTMKNAVITGNENLERFADVAGMTASEFQESFEEDAAGAITEFIKGLDRINEEGGSVVKALDDIGLADQRLIREFSKVAANSDQLTEALDRGKKAWQENTALTEEARTRYGTTKSTLQILKNVVNDVAIEFGQTMLPAIKDSANTIIKNMPKIVSAIKTGMRGFFLFSEAIIRAQQKTFEFIESYLRAMDLIPGIDTTEAQENLGAMSDSFESNADMVSTFRGKLEEIDPSMFKMGKRTRDVTKNLTTLTHQLVMSSDKTDKQRKMSSELQVKMGDVQTAQVKYNEAVRKEGPISDAARKAKENLKDKQGELRTALQKSGVDLDKSAKKTQNLGKKEDVTKEKTDKMGGSMRTSSGKADELAGGAGRAAGSSNDLLTQAGLSPRPLGEFRRNLNSTSDQGWNLSDSLRSAWSWAKDLFKFDGRTVNVGFEGSGGGFGGGGGGSFQHGGITSGGTALVGERGPELVNLPSGSQVTPNNQMSTTNNNTVNLNVNVGMFAGSPMERREIAETLMEDLKDVARKNNTTPMEMLGG